MHTSEFVVSCVFASTPIDSIDVAHRVANRARSTRDARRVDRVERTRVDEGEKSLAFFWPARMFPRAFARSRAPPIVAASLGVISGFYIFNDALRDAARAVERERARASTRDVEREE